MACWILAPMGYTESFVCFAISHHSPPCSSKVGKPMCFHRGGSNPATFAATKSESVQTPNLNGLPSAAAQNYISRPPYRRQQPEIPPQWRISSALGSAGRRRKQRPGKQCAPPVAARGAIGERAQGGPAVRELSTTVSSESAIGERSKGAPVGSRESTLPQGHDSRPRGSGQHNSGAKEGTSKSHGGQGRAAPQRSSGRTGGSKEALPVASTAPAGDAGRARGRQRRGRRKERKKNAAQAEAGRGYAP